MKGNPDYQRGYEDAVYDGDTVFAESGPSEDIRMTISAIKRGVAHEAIFYLQRAFGHDTAMVELIETEWRKL